MFEAMSGTSGGKPEAIGIDCMIDDEAVIRGHRIKARRGPDGSCGHIGEPLLHKVTVKASHLLLFYGGGGRIRGSGRVELFGGDLETFTVETGEP